jgi:hypothetical protein
MWWCRRARRWLTDFSFSLLIVLQVKTIRNERKLTSKRNLRICRFVDLTSC